VPLHFVEINIIKKIPFGGKHRHEDLARVSGSCCLHSYCAHAANTGVHTSSIAGHWRIAEFFETVDA